MAGIILPELVADNPSLKDSEKILCGRIITLCRESGSTEVTNQELAAYSGQHHVTVSNLVSSLQMSGLIDVDIKFLGRAGKGRTIQLSEELQQAVQNEFGAYYTAVVA